MTTPKRKISYEQAQALTRGQKIARANQRARVAERQAREAAAAEHARKRAEHECRFGNWEYSADYTTETRVCRDPECGKAETREIRF
jgi:hypothetical protein